MQRIRWRAWVALTVSFACLAHCTDIQPPTRVNITLDAPEDLRTRVAYVDVEVSGALAESEHTATLSKRLTPAGGWPLRWMVVRGDPEARRYNILALANDGGGRQIASVRAVGEFRDQETVQLALWFDKLGDRRDG